MGLYMGLGWAGREMGLGRLALLLLLAGLAAEACEFLEGAEDHMSLTFETDNHGNIKQLTDIELRAYWNQIVTKECKKQLVLVREQEGSQYLGEEGWASLDERPKSRGKKTYNPYLEWNVEDVVPCREHRVRLYLGEDYREAYLEPATAELMALHQYGPGRVAIEGLQQGHLHWTGSECATDFAVTVLDTEEEEEISEENTSSHHLALKGLSPCTSYTFIVIPYVGTYEASKDEDESVLLTGPSLAVLGALEPQVEEEEGQVTVTWPVTEQTSCVEEYEVEVCELESPDVCHRDTVATKEEGLATSQIAGLALQTEFSVKVLAHHSNLVTESQAATFHTPILVQSLTVTAQPLDHSTVRLTWDHVNIATSVTVLRREEGLEDWEEVTSLSQQDIQKSGPTYDLEQTPCARMQYALRLAVRDTLYPPVQAAYPEGLAAITLTLDETAAFTLPSLHTEATSRSLAVSWLAQPCIYNYRLSLASSDEDTREVMSDTMEYTFTGLEPCTAYTLSILPVMGEALFWEGGPLLEDVMTGQELRPPAQESLHVGSWDSREGQVEISWVAISCAHQYQVSIPDLGTLQHTEETSLLMQLTPCSQQSIQVSSVGQDSEAISEHSAVTSVTSGPQAAALEMPDMWDLEVQARNVSLRLSLTDKTSCVEAAAFLCEGSPCGDWLEMELTEDGSELYFTREDILPGTHYSISVSLSFAGAEEGTKEINFMSLLDLSGLAPSAEAMEEVVLLQWEEVEGAQGYRLFQQYRGDNETQQLDTVSSQDATSEEGILVARITDQSFCSMATYLVQAIKDGLDEQEMVASNPVTVLPNNTVPYKAEDLLITRARGEAMLEWQHLPCVQGYTVTFTSQDRVQIQEEVSAAYSDETVKLSTQKLDDCKRYSIIISPRFLLGSAREEWEAAPEIQDKIQIRNESECKAKARSKRPSSSSRRRSSSPSHMPGLALILATLAVIAY